MLKYFPNRIKGMYNGYCVYSQCACKGMLCSYFADCMCWPPPLSQPCPVETPDFRAEQCSNYNNRSIFGGPTNWKPTEEGTLVVACIGLSMYRSNGNMTD